MTKVKKNSSVPLVSIVTPAFNQGEYIDDTIESVLAQTYPNIEYIVIDDGSTDTTWSKLQKWKDQVLCMTHQNVGQAKTLNDGWQIASGEVLGYLSSDDLLDPTAVERLMTAYQGGDAVIFGRYRLIDQDGKTLHSKSITFNGYEDMIHDFNCPIGPGALFSASLFREFGGWNTGLRQIPDFDFWMRIGRKAKFVLINEEIASFRVHTGSQTFSSSSIGKADESISAMVSLFDSPYTQGLNRKRALASAYVFSFCLHFRSGRVRMAFGKLFTALSFGAIYVASISNLKRLAGTIYSLVKYRNIK